MTAFLGRSIGLWGTLAAIAGAAVMIPSLIALVFALAAAVPAVF